jgi:hypothetical protein
MHQVGRMSPTILKEKGYRFFFFSREEPKMHVHVICSDGEAKFWLQPNIELARTHDLSQSQLVEIRAIIEEHYEKLRSAWEEHLGS